MSSLLRKVAATLHRQRTRRITIGALTALEDMALTDIGVERSQIRSVVEDLLYKLEPAPARPVSHVAAWPKIGKSQTTFAYDRAYKAAA